METTTEEIRILVVEDDPDIKELIAETLREDGWEAVCASNGIEALCRFEKERFDLIITDVLMPGMDGYSLIKRVRRISRIPIIILSAKTEDADQIVGLGIGADDYLLKPISMNLLEAKVEALLRRTREYTGREEKSDYLVRYGDFVLDCRACVLKRSGDEIELLNKEYKLMELFLKNPGQVITKKQIYNAVWNEEYCYDDNTIMVTLSRLRSKIEKDGQHYIHNIRGLGYKFLENGNRTDSDYE